VPVGSALSVLDLQLGVNNDNIKKLDRRSGPGEMRAEYDFSKGVRGKHAAQYQLGTNVVVLEPDVASAFPTAEDVNETLRAISKLIKRQKNRLKRKIS
jgi:hypothetical protein